MKKKKKFDLGTFPELGWRPSLRPHSLKKDCARGAHQQGKMSKGKEARARKLLIETPTHEKETVKQSTGTRPARTVWNPSEDANG